MHTRILTLQSEHSPEARHEADSFEPAEWSEQLTPGQSGWLGAAAVGSIPALALSHSQSILWLTQPHPSPVFLHFSSHTHPGRPLPFSFQERRLPSLHRRVLHRRKTPERRRAVFGLIQTSQGRVGKSTHHQPHPSRTRPQLLCFLLRNLELTGEGVRAGQGCV